MRLFALHSHYVTIGNYSIVVFFFGEKKGNEREGKENKENPEA